jgi:transcriptional regulator with XRE-family HTH domain
MSNELSAKAVGERMRNVRIAKGIASQTVMATLMGVQSNRYNNWEKGVALITPPDAIGFCTYTGATLDYIYRGDGSALPLNLATLLTESKLLDASKK